MTKQLPTQAAPTTELKAESDLPAPKQTAGKATAVPRTAKPGARPDANPPSRKPTPRAVKTAAVGKAVAVPADVAAATAGSKQKLKLVRDSFTIPADEYQLLASLKQRAAQLAHHAKKSEVLRAGVQVLSSLPDARFLAALAAVPSLKTGRPKQDVVAVAARSGKKSAR